MLFQDDLIHGAEGVKKARRANEKINLTMKQRGLSLNQEKSVFLILG